MKKILWLSRHDLTEEQLTDLERIYGEIEVKRHSQSIKTWKEVVEVGKDCDIFAVVLPPAIIAELVNPCNNRKPVIRAKANRIETGGTIMNHATGKAETEYKFQHIGWEQVLKIEVVTKAL